MGLPDMERAFPRGGKAAAQSTEKKVEKKKSHDNLFSVKEVKKSKSKSKAPSKTSQPTKDNGITLSTFVTPLDHKILSEGMLVLGCIEEIYITHLWISLPGRIMGRAPLSSISSAYTKQIQDDSDSVLSLAEIFSVGQNVVTKVMEKKYDEKNDIILSVNPKDIHSDIFHNMIKQGMVLTGAVHTIEDHGFRIDFGIEGVHAFLKNEDAESYVETVNNNAPLVVGQLARFLITNAKSSLTMTTVEVSADPTEVAAAVVPSQADVNPFTVVPGMRFRVTISAVLHEGLKIKWKGFDGYVYQDHLASPCNASDNQPNASNSKLDATVLYSVPLVRTVYFTLQSPSPFTYQMLSGQGIPYECPIQLGQTITSAEVIYSNFRGISLKILKTGIRGFVPSKYVADFNQMPDDIRAKYPAGTRLTCRVMKYDPMDKVFICTMQKSLLNQEVLVANELEPGMVVDCKILQFKKSVDDKPPGLLVQIGLNHKLKAFVPGFFVSDTLVMDLQKRFQIGQQLQGKVIKVNQDNHQILLALKKSLVESETCIPTSYDDAKLGTWVQGVVTWLKRNTYHISFFNDVRGTLDENDIPVEVRPKVSLGATVTCKVVMCNPESNIIKLSMQTLDDKHDEDEAACQIGKEYKVSVLQVSEDGVYVKACNSTAGFGFIPCLQVSEDLDLAKALLESFAPGQRLKATCLLPHAKPAATFTLNVSMKEALAESSKSLEFKSVVTSVVNTVNNTGVTVDLANAEKSANAFVPFQFLSTKIIDPSKDKFYSGQGFFSKIIAIGNEGGKTKMTASSKLGQFWDHDLKPSLSLLESFLAKSEQVLNYLQRTKDPLCSLKCGHLVKAKVSNVCPKSHAELSLENGVLGHVTAYHFEGLKIQTGQEVKGVVLRVDAAHKRVELSLRNDVIKKISRNQESCPKPDVDSKHRAEVLLSTPSFTLAVLKGEIRGRVVYIPCRKHLNDFFPTLVEVGAIKNFTVSSVSTSYVIVYPTIKNKALKVNKRKISIEPYPTKENKAQKVKKRKISIEPYPTKENKAQKVKKRKISIEPYPTEEQEAKIVVKKQPKPVKPVSDTWQVSTEENIEELVSETPVESIAKRVKQSKRSEKNEIAEVTSIKKKAKRNKIDGVGAVIDTPVVEDIPRNVKQTTNSMTNFVKKPVQKPVLKPVKKPVLKRVSEVEERVLPRLEVKGSFVWDVPEPSNEDMAASSSDDDEDLAPKKRLSLAEKRALARKEEARIVQAEQRLMDEDRSPQTADDFDRLVMASPDSSIIWVQYMAYHLQATEIEKARAVAQKALKTISFREEQEKLNVWVALLNLENLYGTQESLDKTLKEAVQMNDSLKVYTRMLEIFKDSNKVEEGDALFSTMLSKFRALKDVWVQGGTFYYATGQVEKARNLLQKGLKSLENKDHVSVICAFAYLENRFSSPERAHTLFEHVLSSYPRRTDVWISYVDLLVKANNVEAARHVLERGITQKIPARKMRILFKKFLDFEQEHGTDEGAEAVRKMAKEYVQKVSSAIPQIDDGSD